MAVILLVTVLVGLIAPLQSEYAQGWESDTSAVNIACSSGFLTITNANYYAPSNFFCSWMHNAKTVAQSKCNNKASCSISTKPGQFFGEPCWGSKKIVKVWYECKSCPDGEYFTGSTCASCPLGTYSESEMRSDTRCGPSNPLADGSPGQCDGNNADRRCCSPGGWCGKTKDHCECSGCTDFSKRCSACPAGKSVRVGDGKHIDDCGTVAYQSHPNKFLSGYSSGTYNFGDLYVAQAECIKRNDCGGVTFEPKTNKYTLRKGPTIRQSSTSNPEMTWTPLKFYGKPCICSHIDSGTWTATDIVYDVESSKVIPVQPSTVGHKTIYNRGSTEESQSISVTEGMSTSTSFSHSAGASVTVGATFSFGVPLVFEGEVSTEVSASYDFSYGTDRTVSKETTAEFSCTGAANKKSVCKVLLFKEKYDIPYTMTWTKNSEKVCKCETKGVFKEVAGIRMETQKDEYDL